MNAQPLATGRSAIAFAGNTHTVPTPSPAEATTVAPNLSQTFDRWNDLPDDVAVPVMYWLMRATGAVPLALASQRFLHAGQVFRAGPWFEGAKSVLMHERSVAWASAYLRGMAHGPRKVYPRTPEALCANLQFLASSGEDMRMALAIDGKPLPAAPGADWRDPFRRYPGASLGLATGMRNHADAKIIEIARILPPQVCLCLDIYLNSVGLKGTLKGLAGLLSSVAQTGRLTAFEMQWGLDLSADPAELGAVLDIACGAGAISHINFGTANVPDAMLRAISERCERFRHLKLVMFDCTVLPGREALLELAAALERRQAAGQSRVTVVVDSASLLWVEPSDCELMSAGERAAFESAGLYLACLNGEPPTHPAVQKVIRSIGKGVVDTWSPAPRESSADEFSSDSDVIIESSDSEPLPDFPDLAGLSSEEEQESQEESADEGPAHRAEEPDERTEKRSRKRGRDHCVIS